VNDLPGLASNCILPDLCLLSSEDYRCEPLHPDDLVFSGPHRPAPPANLSSRCGAQQPCPAAARVGGGEPFF
jgi:hypothetical protein